MELSDFSNIILSKGKVNKYYKVILTEPKILENYFKECEYDTKILCKKLGEKYSTVIKLLKTADLIKFSPFKNGKARSPPPPPIKTELTKWLESICVKKIPSNKTTTYIIKCQKNNCTNLVKARSAKNATFSCRSCSKKGEGFSAAYKKILNDSRKIPCNLTFVEFLEFTKISNCEYCNCFINWDLSKHRNKNSFSYKYFLDRKDSKVGYTKNNCVVCCTRCNFVKSNKFTHSEFMKIGTVLKEIDFERNKNGI